QGEGGADEYAIVTSEDDFGLDASGVELLPADTVYRIHEMAGTEHTDTVELRRTSQGEGGADEYAIVTSEDDFGLDASGVELLPADT
ncbi:hypothetical protein CTI14_65830, partial [Methylobacterium radiotolerans]